MNEGKQKVLFFMRELAEALIEAQNEGMHYGLSMENHTNGMRMLDSSGQMIAAFSGLKGKLNDGNT